MDKKVQLSDLNLNSFVVKLDKQQAKTAKGGKSYNYKSVEDKMTNLDLSIFGKGPFTEHKSQRAYGNGFTIKNRRR